MNEQLILYTFAFIIYGAMGWVVEVIYTGISKNNYVNRGFLFSPILPIYGFGAVLILYLLRDVENNVFLVFIYGMIITSALEYVASVILEKAFHVKWWDYSKHKFNFQGRICLTNSIMFGILCVVLVFGVNPYVEKIALDIGYKRLNIYNNIVLIGLIIDLYFSLRKLNNLPARDIRLFNVKKKDIPQVVKDLKLDELESKYQNNDSDYYLKVNLIISIVIGIIISLLTDYQLGFLSVIPTMMFLYTIRNKQSVIIKDS